MLGTDDRTYCPVRDYNNWCKGAKPLSQLGVKPRVRVKAWNEEHVICDGKWVPLYSLDAPTRRKIINRRYNAEFGKEVERIFLMGLKGAIL